MEQRSAFSNHTSADSKGALIAASFDDAERIGEIHGVYSLEFALDAIRHTLMDTVRRTDLIFEVRLGLFVVFARGASLDQGYMIEQRLRHSTIEMPAYSGFDVQLRMCGVTTVKPVLFDKLLQRARRYSDVVQQTGLTPAAHALMARLAQQKMPYQQAA